jgi:hypothetical protein
MDACDYQHKTSRIHTISLEIRSGKMSRKHGLAILAVLAIAASGCGKSADTPTTLGSGTSQTTNAVAQTRPTDGPEGTITQFLDALRTGNDDIATKLLSTAAREKSASLSRGVTPPASDTAKFAVGKVDYINDDGARVACTWTDLDEEGESRTDEAIWVLRRETSGWRVCGVAAKVFPDAKPLLLNFEDPEDMARQKQWMREEIRRRMESESLQAQSPEKPENSLRK